MCGSVERVLRTVHSSGIPEYMWPTRPQMPHRAVIHIMYIPDPLECVASMHLLRLASPSITDDQSSPPIPGNVSCPQSDRHTNRLHTYCCSDTRDVPIQQHHTLSRHHFPPSTACLAPANFLATNSTSARPLRHMHQCAIRFPIDWSDN